MGNVCLGMDEGRYGLHTCIFGTVSKEELLMGKVQQLLPCKQLHVDNMCSKLASVLTLDEVVVVRSYLATFIAFLECPCVTEHKNCCLYPLLKWLQMYMRPYPETLRFRLCSTQPALKMPVTNTYNWLRHVEGMVSTACKVRHLTLHLPFPLPCICLAHLLHLVPLVVNALRQRLSLTCTMSSKV